MPRPVWREALDGGVAGRSCSGYHPNPDPRNLESTGALPKSRSHAKPGGAQHLLQDQRSPARNSFRKTNL